MGRKSSSKAIEALGMRVTDEVWECYDKHVKLHGKPTDADNFMRDVAVSNANGKVMLRFGNDNVDQAFAFESVDTPVAAVTIISLDEDEVIMTTEEAKQIFSALGF